MKKQSGSVLVLTAITIAVLMVAGVSFVSHTTVEYKANVNSTRTLQAFYLAEGGLAWGLEKLDTFIAAQITPGSTNVRLPNPGELAPLFDFGSLSSSGIPGTTLDLTVDPSNNMKGILTATALHNGASNSVSQEVSEEAGVLKTYFHQGYYVNNIDLYEPVHACRRMWATGFARLRGWPSSRNSYP